MSSNTTHGSIKPTIRRHWPAMIFFALAFVSVPVQGLDWFTPSTKATFTFGVIETLTHYNTLIYTRSDGAKVIVNETVILSITVGNGFVVLKGAGGLSAGNPLNMSVTFYFFNNTVSNEVPNMTFRAVGAYAAEVKRVLWLSIPQDTPKTNDLGFPEDANITLTKQGNRWSGNEWVVYNQGGALTPSMIIGNITFNIIGPIEISSEAVTVAARTNSLLVGLTWIIIAFTVVEIRRER